MAKGRSASDCHLELLTPTEKSMVFDLVICHWFLETVHHLNTCSKFGGTSVNRLTFPVQPQLLLSQVFGQHAPEFCGTHLIEAVQLACFFFVVMVQLVPGAIKRTVGK
jgi:hypothetical protein